MNFLPPALAAFVLAVATGALTQTGKQEPARPTTSKGPVTVEQLRGAWKLTDFVTDALRKEKRLQTGYMLITDDFLSFECHIGWLTDAGQREASTFFAGTHEYRLRGSDLVMRQLIGSTMDPNGTTPVFEPLGRIREYRVRFSGTKLQLIRDSDDQTFEFERVTSGQTGLDLYGRKRKPEEPEAPAPAPPKERKEPKDG